MVFIYGASFGWLLAAGDKPKIMMDTTFPKTFPKTNEIEATDLGMVNLSNLRRI